MVEKEIYSKYLKEFVEEEYLGEIAFVKDGKLMPSVYQRECTLVQFFQPSFWETLKD